MAKLEQPFNVADVPERDDFTPVPPGAYTVMITSSEPKATKAGGEMIELELDIVEGDHQGRKLFERLNIKNDNPKAVDIAYRTLAEIVKAVGKSTIKDTEEVHNKRLVVNVVVEPAKPYMKDGVQQPGSPQNAIKRYLPFTGTVPQVASTVATQATPTAQPTAQATATSPSNSAPPWARNKG